MEYTVHAEASGKYDSVLGMPMVVMADRNSDHTFADNVLATGTFEYAIQGVRKDLAWLGYKRLILKSEQEPAIMSLKAAIQRETPG